MNKKNIRQYFHPLEQSFISKASPEDAIQMKRYMREQFEFYGIKSQVRERLYKEFIREYGLPSPENPDDYIIYLWEKPQRDFQYTGMFIIEGLLKNADENIIELLEYMISVKSWWDTVDYISAKLAGRYFIKYPEQIKSMTGEWMESGNMWLQRSSLLFQLKYKKNTDEALLYQYIERLSGHKDFFIRKAIGWTLREYSKTNPGSVVRFIQSHELSPLSVREGMRVINRQKS